LPFTAPARKIAKAQMGKRLLLLSVIDKNNYKINEMDKINTKQDELLEKIKNKFDNFHKSNTVNKLNN